ncbi:MAG: hypothetical protein R3A79_29370 [Nannocystaceae bacterium]
MIYTIYTIYMIQMIRRERSRDERGDDACLSDLVLDQVRVGELARESIAAHLDGCARCREREAALRGAHEDAELPPLELPPLELPGSAAIDGRRRGWGRAGLGGLALAAAALVLVLVRPGAPGEDPLAVPATRTKGGAALHFHVRRGGAVLEGGPGELLRPGDALRFSYSWSAGGTVAVLSRDGAGTVSTYFPAGARSFAATPGEEVELPGAVELDAVLGDEALYGFFCADEVAVAELERAVAARPDAPAVRGCVVDQVRVRKAAAR